MPDIGGAARTHQAVPDATADVAAIKVVTDAIPDAGAIHWHCVWEPRTDDGFVEEA